MRVIMDSHLPPPRSDALICDKELPRNWNESQRSGRLFTQANEACCDQGDTVTRSHDEKGLSSENSQGKLRAYGREGRWGSGRYVA